MREQLHWENEALRAEVAALRAENEQLKSSLARREEDAQWRAQRQGLVEAELSHLVRLRVATQRLHESLQPLELLDILQDLLINLVGSEMLGIFEREGAELVLRVSLGIDAERFRRLPLEEDGPIGRSARSGASWLEELMESGSAQNRTHGPRACVPLRLGGHVLGMMVLFGLLPHKPRLEPEDRELLELLATEGGRALFCARGMAAGKPS
ncbi:GAF domain-containing protein [Archangium gephyra]|uniref:GAF domain protein n=1 Tax=Archangium gephyra TaxID=48 RepID=A0AAC8TJB9_9BACT|nr:GAF domain-containing protein [Archangium gephyra]AKJ08132.1 GAF domain protein [Archangium gephyra]REG29866.1 GAF domain-containing protein [Archangium gephyra]